MDSGSFQSPDSMEPEKMTLREKFKKWKEEKELKKQLEARKKIPVFKVCRVNPERSPSSVHTVTALENKDTSRVALKFSRPAMLSSKAQVNPLNSPSASNSTSCSTSRIVKPPPSKNSAIKQIPQTLNISMTAATNKVTNRRAGTAPRIGSPHSSNKQGTTKTNASADRDLKGPQKKVPRHKGIKVLIEKEIKSGRMEEDFDDSDLQSVCEGKSCVEKKKASPDHRAKFPFPFGSPRLIEMYAEVCGIPVPWESAENKSPQKSKSEDQKEESKMVERKAEVAPSESPKLTKEDKVATEEEQSASLRKLKDSPVKLEGDSQSTQVDAGKQTKCTRKEEEFDDSDLLESICEEKSCAGKKRATKSLAPDDSALSVPHRVAKFAFPFSKPHLLEMYAEMCDISVPEYVRQLCHFNEDLS